MGWGLHHPPPPQMPAPRLALLLCTCWGDAVAAAGDAVAGDAAWSSLGPGSGPREASCNVAEFIYNKDLENDGGSAFLRRWGGGQYGAGEV